MSTETIAQNELMSPDSILPFTCVHGALLGAAVGDALGWPQEQNAGRLGEFILIPEPLAFIPWKRKIGKYVSSFYQEEIAAGEYSDDTQLLLATARSIVRGGDDWAKRFSHQELPLWLLYERGGGGATKRAAALWLKGETPWSTNNTKELESYFNAGGNGVAMRVLPHALMCGHTQDDVMRNVMRNGILTHGHPRALLGAIVYAYAAWWLTHAPSPVPFGEIIDMLLDEQPKWEYLPETNPGEKTNRWLEIANNHFRHGYRSEWHQTAQEIRNGLLQCQQALGEGALANDTDVLKALGCIKSKENGSGVVAALSVLYLFAMHAADPEIGLRTIAFAKHADTDTLASMLGGLFGIVYGIEWLPTSLRHVQDHDLIADMATKLAHSEGSSGETSSNTRWGSEDKQKTFALLESGQTTDIPLGTLGKATIQSERYLETYDPDLTVREWRLQTTSLQTVYIKKMYKESKQRYVSARRPAEENGQAQQNFATTNNEQTTDLKHAVEHVSLKDALALINELATDNMLLFFEQVSLKDAFVLMKTLWALAQSPSENIPDIPLSKTLPLIVQLNNTSNEQDIRSVVAHHADTLSQDEQEALMRLLQRVH